ncbi:MAG: hypothetical protein IJJ76_01145 [Ruminococcus sp.]|uniref:hypothetical protein n=1 Tax=Ruminococcus sp. TaxID=41978 RepID=UPI0025CF73B4|nr:hypothetical protein [Ruminococcus sp.]MBR0528356.1 hypothetical protein [Ruminococcus sp.]
MQNTAVPVTSPVTRAMAKFKARSFHPAAHLYVNAQNHKYYRRHHTEQQSSC